MLSFINDDDVPEYDFKKNETPHVNPAFLPVSPPGPTCATPPGRGTALDYFQLFYDDSFLGAIVDFTNRNAATRAMQQLVSLPETSRTGSGPTFPCKS